MKYEAPELNVLTAAINAIQVLPKREDGQDAPIDNDSTSAYVDWE